MDALGRYLGEVAATRHAGVKETSFYPALAALFDAAGAALKPRVRCVIHPAGKGAGLPDGGFFTLEQLKGDPDTLAAMQANLLPARGVLEAKGAADDAPTVAASPQVAKYLARYGLVLVTNLRDFLLVGKGPDGAAATIERYTLAPTEAAFWEMAAHPAAAVAAHGPPFADFLARALLHAAPLARPQDLAWFLASYARDARLRLAGRDLPALASVRTALTEALGLRFAGKQGDDFFLSTFLQTLFYGVFSAWVLWHTEQPTRTDRFDWRTSEWFLRVPAIAALFETLATRRILEPLGLVDALDRAAATLNRVDRPAFFAAFAADEAVTYFYEPFLRAFDPALREQLGVWYTPPEVVRYMVARADAAVREELGIPLGLADPDVWVLDPCCGTGAYLVEATRLIARRLADGGDALGGDDLRRAATARLVGFEILPAPYVVAHLQLGLLLTRLGAPLGEGERAAVYLTNALTGWHKVAGEDVPLAGFPELAAERDAAARVKQDAPVLVVLGNPPYNGFAGAAADEERDLGGAYRVAKATKQPQGKGLNDLFLRFFRAAERRIVDGTGAGVVCLIANNAWLDGLSYPAMRERYMGAFDRVDIDNLNGDKYRTGKVAPDGTPDPSVFSTAHNREGIQVGTAVATLVRRRDHEEGGVAVVRYRDFWGRDKGAALLASLEQPDAAPYRTLAPPPSLGLPFLPSQGTASYEVWSPLPALFPASYPGIQTARDDALVSVDRDALVRRMEVYFDPAADDQQVKQVVPSLTQDGGRFNAKETRAALVKRGFLPDNVVRFTYRPFDTRWLYWEPETDLLDRKREDYFPHVFPGNVALVSQQKPRREWSLPLVISSIGDLALLDRGATCFPMLLRPTGKTLFDPQGSTEPQPNLSDAARAYLATVGGDAADLFHHALAVLHAPAYRVENAGALRQDWPRVPLPATGDALLASAALGRRVAALLDAERGVPGVSDLSPRPDLAQIAVVRRVGGGMLNKDAGDLAVTAGWGHGGGGAPVMPARGKATEREYTDAERAALTSSDPLALALLGETCHDVYLNGVAYWACVPANVWRYTLGGYQVLKKWLSYRERRVLGRDLRTEEVREATRIARRVAALLTLAPALDANYAAASLTAADGTPPP